VISEAGAQQARADPRPMRERIASPRLFLRSPIDRPERYCDATSFHGAITCVGVVKASQTRGGGPRATLAGSKTIGTASVVDGQAAEQTSPIRGWGWQESETARSSADEA